MQSIIKRTSYTFISLLSVGILMLPVTAGAISYKTKNNSFCAALSATKTSAIAKVTSIDTKHKAAQTAYGVKVNATRANNDAARTVAINSAAAKRAANYAKLEKKAKTPTQTGVVTTYESAINSLVTAKNNADNTALSTYRTAADNAIATYNTAVNTHTAAFLSGVTTAGTDATTACSSRTDSSPDLSAAYKSDMSAVKSGYTSGRPDRTTATNIIKTALGVRNTTRNTNKNTYKTGVNAARTALKNNFK